MERFFYGCASGTDRKVLNEASEPVDLMINYASSLNRPIKNRRMLFIDSGGFSFFFKGGVYDDTLDDYFSYLLRVRPDFFAARDYPCEPELCKIHSVTVRENQETTLKNEMEMVDSLPAELQGKMVSVVQGWEIEDYLYMLDRMREQGVLTPMVAIGSVCRRNQDSEIRDVITAIRENLPTKYRLHAFGVKVNALRFKDVFDGLWSADSMAYAFTYGMGLKGDQVRYRFVVANFERFRAKIDYYFRVHKEQRTLMEI